jgi:hypothetical protein
LGAGKRQAILTALSRKSYWHSSRTLATQAGMTNHWRDSQELASVRHLWLQALVCWLLRRIYGCKKAGVRRKQLICKELTGFMSIL